MALGKPRANAGREPGARGFIADVSTSHRPLGEGIDESPDRRAVVPPRSLEFTHVVEYELRDGELSISAIWCPEYDGGRAGSCTCPEAECTEPADYEHDSGKRDDPEVWRSTGRCWAKEHLAEQVGPTGAYQVGDVLTGRVRFTRDTVVRLGPDHWNPEVTLHLPRRSSGRRVL